MRTFPIKVHYKVIEILAVRWLGTNIDDIVDAYCIIYGTKLMQIFKETTTSDES